MLIQNNYTEDFYCRTHLVTARSREASKHQVIHLSTQSYTGRQESEHSLLFGLRCLLGRDAIR